MAKERIKRWNKINKLIPKVPTREGRNLINYTDEWLDRLIKQYNKLNKQKND